MALSSVMQEALMEMAKRKRTSISVNLELLPVCNLDCKMCYIRTSMAQVEYSGGLKATEEWLALARELREAGVLFLLLTGGEVFLYPRFKELYIELYKLGFMITINTNATLIDESVTEWLEQYPPKCVSISLYGASEETYQKLCGAKGMFDRVKHAIMLLAKKRIRYEIKTMFTPLNICDMAHCCAIGQNLGVFHETGFYSFPPARKIDREKQVRFSPEEVVDYTFKRNQLLSSEEGFKRGVLEHLKKYENAKEKPGGTLYGFTCGASNNSCWITWQGKMTPCALLPEPYVLPFETGFIEAWEELKEKCDQILMSPKCSHCDKREVCLVCPAANYGETGSFEKASPFHCRMTEKQLLDMKRMVCEWKENGWLSEEFE